MIEPDPRFYLIELSNRIKHAFICTRRGHRLSSGTFDFMEWRGFDTTIATCLRCDGKVYIKKIRRKFEL